MTPKRKSVVVAETGTVMRYVIAGLIGNGLVLLIHYAFSFGLHWDPKVSFTAACVSVLPLAFFLSRNWSFRSSVPLGRAFVQFCMAYGASFLFQFGILYLGLLFGAHHEIIVPIGQILAVLFFFTLQRFFIFAVR